MFQIVSYLSNLLAKVLQLSYQFMLQSGLDDNKKG